VIDGADLDHIALAAEARQELEIRYGGELGGKPLAAGLGPGFRWAQLEYANGMVVEMLDPDRVEHNDFLRRFLDRNGPGPHHLTFKIPDFGAALEAARTAGYNPVGIDDSDPHWKEAFLHPKDAPGVVVQLAESHEPIEDLDPGFYPINRLTHVSHAVASMDDGLRLFGGLLGGQTVAEGKEDGYIWSELAWPGPGRVRLLQPNGAGPLADWLGPRPGRVHHLAFAVAEPSGMAGATREGEFWTVDPSENLGTRLVLTPA
jgi:catechol 2,3-dioxygenase-like lactoylglutathione lyase family enzyme